MVCESGEVDAEVDETDSKPEELDDDDMDGAVTPFAATRDVEEGQSGLKPFVSFCGAGEGVEEAI